VLKVLAVRQLPTRVWYGVPVAPSVPAAFVRELESSLQQFGEFLLKARLVKEKAAPYYVRFVRQFLAAPATRDPLADRVQQFCEALERNGAQDWQVRQADQALRIYFVNFLERTDWRATEPGSHDHLAVGAPRHLPEAPSDFPQCRWVARTRTPPARRPGGSRAGSERASQVV
jgi:hypothetical protein